MNPISYILTVSRSLRVASVTALAVVLAACGGGSSSSPDIATPIKAFSITNTGMTDFAKVSIIMQDGTVAYDKEFLCAANQQRCRIDYTGLPLNGNVTLLFQDRTNKLVSAFTHVGDPRTSIKIHTSKWATGNYLYNKMVKAHLPSLGATQSRLDIRLDRFFKDYNSPDGKSDEYEEIATYFYATGLSEHDFLTMFIDRLKKNEVALPSELSPAISEKRPILLAASSLTAPDCAGGVQDFLSVGGNVAKAFPVIGDVLGSAFDIGSAYCDNTDAKLDAIASKLDALQNSVDALSNSIGDITLFLADTQQNMFTTQAKQLKEDMLNYESNYEEFLELKQQPSLLAYFEAKGGWNNAIADGETVLANILMAPYNGSSVSGYLTKIDQITANENFKSYLKGLNLKCTAVVHSTSATVDMFQRRQGCNVAIVVNTANIVGAQGIANRLTKDIYAVFAQYSKFAVNSYSTPYWVANYSANEVKNKFDGNQQAAIVKYQTTINEGKSGGYFDAFSGLPDGLAQNMKSSGCQSVKGYDVPAITAWYLGTSADDDRIITQCGEYDNNSIRFQARYFLKDGADFWNVMGVGVPGSSLSAGDVGAYATPYSPNGVGLGMVLNTNVAFNSIAYDSIRDRYFRNQANTIAPMSPGDYCPAQTRGSLCFTDNWKAKDGRALAWAGIPSVRSYWYNLVRFTQDDYSYAIKVAVGSGGVNPYVYTYCTTSDCSVTGDYYLSFRYGVKNLSWYSGPGGEPAGAPLFWELWAN